MNIRFVKETDIEQLVELCRAHAAYEKAAFDSKNKAKSLSIQLFKPQTPIKCIVVEINKELFGYATFMKQFSIWDADFYVYLDCLYLKEDIRGKGIGQDIMNAVKEYALKEKCKIIQWQTPNFNTDAIRFYRKTGAKSRTKERFFWEI